jgi:hypothetical protein
VYKCHLCSHHNVKRGTPKGHLRKIFLANDKSSLDSTSATKPIARESSKLEKRFVCKEEAGELHVFASKVVVKDVANLNGMETPPRTITPNLFEGKKRMRNSSISKNAIGTPSISARVEEVAKTHSTARKRRKKSWTGLKEIAQSKEHLTIPFFYN